MLGNERCKTISIFIKVKYLNKASEVQEEEKRQASSKEKLLDIEAGELRQSLLNLNTEERSKNSQNFPSGNLKCFRFLSPEGSATSLPIILVTDHMESVDVSQPISQNCKLV